MKKTHKTAIVLAAFLLVAFLVVFFVNANMREAERQKEIDRQAEIERQIALEAERQKEAESYLSLEPDSKISFSHAELVEFPQRLAIALAAGEYIPGDSDTAYLDGLLVSSGDGLVADYLEPDDAWENMDFAYHSETERYVISYYNYFNADKLSIAIKTITVGEGDDERIYVNFNNQETAKNPPESWITEQILKLEKRLAEPRPMREAVSETTVEPASEPTSRSYSYYPVFERIKEITVGAGHDEEEYPVYILSNEERKKLWSLMRIDEWVVATDLPGRGLESEFFINEEELIEGEYERVQMWFFNQHGEQVLIIPASSPKGGTKMCYFAPADIITDILAYAETLTPQPNE